MHNFNKDTHVSMVDRNFANKLKVTKQFLKNNPDIFSTNAYKGNLTVCLKKSTYNTNMIMFCFHYMSVHYSQMYSVIWS